jgi:hypothetical protein
VAFWHEQASKYARWDEQVCNWCHLLLFCYPADPHLNPTSEQSKGQKSTSTTELTVLHLCIAYQLLHPARPALAVVQLALIGQYILAIVSHVRWSCCPSVLQGYGAMIWKWPYTMSTIKLRGGRMHMVWQADRYAVSGTKRRQFSHCS